MKKYLTPELAALALEESCGHENHGEKECGVKAIKGTGLRCTMPEGHHFPVHIAMAKDSDIKPWGERRIVAIWVDVEVNVGDPSLGKSCELQSLTAFEEAAIAGAQELLDDD